MYVSSSEDCVCKPYGKWLKSNSMRTKYFKINGSRIELRCGKCNGLLTWWMDSTNTKKIVPAKRVWSEEERRSMR
jgi:hypothetical protein